LILVSSQKKKNNKIKKLEISCGNPLHERNQLLYDFRSNVEKEANATVRHRWKFSATFFTEKGLLPKIEKNFNEIPNFSPSKCEFYCLQLSRKFNLLSLDFKNCLHFLDLKRSNKNLVLPEKFNLTTNDCFKIFKKKALHVLYFILGI